MLAGIGNAAVSSSYSSTRGGPTVALEAQLERCQRQLGDWRACESGKTPEGKQIIQTLESKLRDLQLRIADASATSSQPGRIADAGSAVVSARPALPDGDGSGGIGRLLDVYA
jgi:hypothetical protein